MYIASRSASTPSPGERRGPPIVATRSHEAPAPSPSSNRPPLIESSDIAAFAIIAGGRSGRFATSGKIVIRSVRASRSAISIHVSRKRRWYGWSWMPIRSSPAPSAATASSTSFWWSSAFGISETPTSMRSAPSAAEQREHEQEDVEDVEEDRRGQGRRDPHVARPLQPVEVED